MGWGVGCVAIQRHAFPCSSYLTRRSTQYHVQVVARYNASQLVTLRDQISTEVRANLGQRLAESFNITVSNMLDAPHWQCSMRSLAP